MATDPFFTAQVLRELEPRLFHSEKTLIPDGFRRARRKSSKYDYDLQILRTEIYRRDGGICALCGMDCVDLKRALNFVLRQIDRNHPGYDVRKPEFVRALRFGKINHKRETLWDMDHIVPVVFGGAHELSNLRTLCLRCHKDETTRVVHKHPQLWVRP